MSARRISEFDAVFFDAGFTLLLPTRPLWDVYAEVAADFGVLVEVPIMAGAMRAAFAGGARYAFDPELRSSEAAEREAWRRYTLDVAGRIPGLDAVHEPWLDELVRRFDAPAAWRLAPGALELLRALRARGAKTAVVSNWHGALEGIAAAHGLTDAVDFVLTSAAAGRRKPHPEIFERALRAAGAAAARTAHIGDSTTDDVEGARAVGITPILLAGAESEAPSDVRRIDALTVLLSELDAESSVVRGWPPLPRGAVAAGAVQGACASRSAPEASAPRTSPADKETLMKSPHDEAGYAGADVGRLAHDVFNLLTVVYGLQEELASLETSDPRRPLMARTMQTVADRLNEIGKRLHDLGKLGGGTHAAAKT
ncbi:MAG TPA: HAD-IA family hydrolase [Planctomycetota bacterium]|nr:HAD-IA family hydrolase [Planctomycetota bacterium]